MKDEILEQLIEKEKQALKDWIESSINLSAYMIIQELSEHTFPDGTKLKELREKNNKEMID